jgi:hypothetical protein
MDCAVADALRDFGSQEGLCDVGVLGLGPEGWRIISHRRYTNWGSALCWCETEGKRVAREGRYRWSRLRAALVAMDNARGETLNSVCEEYETRRIEGDPQFNQRQQR